MPQLRELTNDFQMCADGCASYEALFSGLAELAAGTHLHVHKENNVLLPAVVALEQHVPSGDVQLDRPLFTSSVTTRPTSDLGPEHVGSHPDDRKHVAPRGGTS